MFARSIHLAVLLAFLPPAPGPLSMTVLQEEGDVAGAPIVARFLPSATSPADAKPAAGQSHSAPIVKAGAGTLPIGMSLHILGPRNRELPFADAMKTSSNWFFPEDAAQRRKPKRSGDKGGGQGAGDGGADRDDNDRGRRLVEQMNRVPTDEHGWPKLGPAQAALCVMFKDMEGHYPGGTYVCTYLGKGELSFEGSGRVTEATSGRLLVQVDPTVGELVLRVSRSDPADPVRDIRVWLPGLEDSTSLFNPVFLEKLAPFSMIRFHQWMRCFAARGVWEEVPKLDAARQSSPEGPAVEIMCKLANEVQADPWFCMPHLAGDDYVRNFATAVKQSLAPERKVYVEYSNEVWNDQVFEQAKWVREQATLRGLRTGDVAADEAKRQWRVWREVFAGEEQRVVRVAAGNLHNPWFLRTMVERLGEEFDALAVATYFGVRAEEQGLSLQSGVDEIMAVAIRNIEDFVRPRLAEHRELVDKLSQRMGRHIPLLTYEGGQNIIAPASIGGPRKLTLAAKAVIACQRSEKMVDGYRALKAALIDNGVELFGAFHLVSELGYISTHAHLEWIDQPASAAPKYRTLIE